MKNKTTTYFLIVGVLVIWGLIFYRVVSGMDSNESDGFTVTKKMPIKIAKTEEEEVFVLLGNYRDPFLGGTSSSIATQGYSDLSNPTISSKKRSPKKEIDWSFIDYIGIVTNKDTKKKVGLLSISGTEYMVNEKDEIAGVTILKKERDSILINYSGSKKWIKR